MCGNCNAPLLEIKSSRSQSPDASLHLLREVANRIEVPGASAATKTLIEGRYGMAFFTFLIVAVVAVIYLAVQKNSPANRQARALQTKLFLASGNRLGPCSGADQRNHILP